MSVVLEENNRLHSDPRRRWLTAGGILLTACACALFLKLFVLDALRVESSSMEGTLLPGDFVLVNKLVYGSGMKRLPFSHAAFPNIPAIREERRGDVVVFDFPRASGLRPDRQENTFVKRCVAVGGDVLEIRDGILLVNGTVTRDYGRNPQPQDASEKAEVFPRGSAFSLNKYGPLRIPKRGECIPLTKAAYALVENVIVAEGHSVCLGPEGKIFVDGVPEETYTVTKDYVFVIGDNFYNSYDSRSWGFLPEENIKGEATLVYWSRGGRGTAGAQTNTVRWSRLGTIVR